MYKAISVAKYIINYSNSIDSPISNLKLQKLLYYVQAAFLVEEGKKCFCDEIVAWAFGPVVPDVYTNILKEFKSSSFKSTYVLFPFSYFFFPKSLNLS